LSLGGVSEKDIKDLFAYESDKSRKPLLDIEKLDTPVLSTPATVRVERYEP
jgi:hypothetical protein